MTNTTKNQELGERIERLVREELSKIREAARTAVQRGFALELGSTSSVTRPQRAAPQRGGRRASSEVATLGEQLFRAVCERPGETMSVLAPFVGSTARELQRPATRLRRAGRIRSVGTRHATRYFPMVTGAAE